MRDLTLEQPRKLFRLHLPPIFDVRAGEGRVALLGFAALLLVIITAHTILETARDALLLTGPGPRALGLVYVAIALFTLPTAAVAGRAGSRFGPRRALSITLALAAIATVTMYLIPTNRTSAVAIYVLSGVIASIAVPQFWTLVGTVLTLAQGRRLFGLIAAAGVVGGVVGSGLAAIMILVVPAKTLLLLSSGIFAAASAAIARKSRPDPTLHSRGGPSRPVANEWLLVFRENPFLMRVAVIVFLSTATLLTVDYLFKSSVARALPNAEIGPFVARYYLGFNVLSLFVQLFVGSALVRAVGIAGALVITPLFLFLGATSALVSGGALIVVLILKGIDGSLRHSIHRITGELVYLPVPRAARQRIKPLIDGALVRTSQTITGVVLLALGGTRALAPRPLALLVAGLAFAWLITAVTIRRPYLDLLRRAIASGSLDTRDNPDPIDLESAQLLVQHLASEDPLEVVGAMSALSRRGREGFVPALVLLHQDETVLVAALEMFGASVRTDWVPLARRLLEHPREGVRMAAARALAMHEDLDPTWLANDAGPRVHGYAILHLALREPSDNLCARPRIAALLREPTESGEPGRLGLLAAIADAPPTRRLVPLLLTLGDIPGGSTERTELFARAAARQADERLIPRLISLLPTGGGREAVRAALVAMKEPAFDALHSVLLDPTRARSLRIHIPKSLARFGTRRAAECLLRSIETEQDGLVRYKSIRGLGILVDGRNIVVDRDRVERICLLDLADHFSVLALRVALAGERHHASAEARSAAERLLIALLSDKLRQSLDRVFRLLKIAHPREAIHRVYLACLSGDAYARANAGEYLDALLARRGQQSLRALFRLIADDLQPAERAERAATLLGAPAKSSLEAALQILITDPELTVATLAGIVALEVDTPALRAAVQQARRVRPELDLSAGQLLDGATSESAAAHA
ncbi:MAG: MFS transporter [Polyangiaceae bacterium]